MEFHVAQLLQEAVGSRREYHVDDCHVQEASGAITGDVLLLRTDAGILATADLLTAVAVCCSRCLAATRVPVRLRIEEEYYPTLDVATGTPLPPPDEPSSFFIDEHHILDIREALRQQLVLAEPMQPLCREDCAGLCPICGADRNLGLCACSGGEIDTRWAVLQDLMKGSD